MNYHNVYVFYVLFFKLTIFTVCCHCRISVFCAALINQYLLSINPTGEQYWSCPHLLHSSNHETWLQIFSKVKMVQNLRPEATLNLAPWSIWLVNIQSFQWEWWMGKQLLKHTILFGKFPIKCEKITLIYILICTKN